MNKEDLIKKEIRKTQGYSVGDGWDNNRTNYGYHSFEFDNINIIGQRRPKMRLKEMNYDFTNKKIIDFGCNVGGMLFCMENIDSGLGYDFDEKVINCAKEICHILERDNLRFEVFDFDKDNYDNLVDFKPDVVLILSLGSWIKKWIKLYQYCINLECDIILEINNIVEGKSQLDFFEKQGLSTEEIISESTDDTTNNKRRKTYLIKNG